MAVVEIAEEHKKVVWNYGGSSDEIFSHGRRYLVGIASPASDYLRTLPHWLAEESPRTQSNLCLVFKRGGTFGWQVARGILESVLAVAGQSVELVPINSSLENYDTILRTLCDIDPEVVVLAGSFQAEMGLMRTRHRWPSTVREVACRCCWRPCFFC